MTPPVVELSARHIVLQGNTRALYCLKEGIEEIRCIVARNVVSPLPTTQRVELRHMMVGGRTLSTEDRYGRRIDQDFRHIEWATHHPDQTLL